MKPVFSTGQGQNNRIVRSFFHQFSIIVAAGTGAVTASHQQEAADSARFDRRNDLVGYRKNRSMSKTCSDLVSAIDSRKRLLLFKAAQFQRLLYHRSEILIRTNMNHSRISHNLCSKNTVLIALFYRHQTVGGK